MSNVEGMYSIYFIKRLSAASPPACKPMKPTGWKRARKDCIAYTSESESILHDSAVRYSIYCGSLFLFPEVLHIPGQFNPVTDRHYFTVLDLIHFCGHAGAMVGFGEGQRRR